MPMPLPFSRMSRRVLRACTLAACSPRSTGMDPTAWKNAFIARPLKPLVVKYSALAKKPTGRGIKAWTITLSRKDKWFGATMKGPSLGTFSSPMTVGRQVLEISPRVVQRMTSKASIVLHLAQGRRADSVKFFDLLQQLRRGVHDGDGACLLKFAVGRKSPTDPDAVKAVGHGTGNILVAVSDHHRRLGTQRGQSGTND